MIQFLPYDGIKFDKSLKLENVSHNRDDSQNAFTIEGDLKNSDNIKEKTKGFPFCPEKKQSSG